MWSQTLQKARLNCVPVPLQLTSGIAYKNITQICLIQSIFCCGVLLRQELLEEILAAARRRHHVCKAAKSGAACDACLQGQRWSSSGCAGMFLFIMSVNLATNEIAANTSIVSPQNLSLFVI